MLSNGLRLTCIFADKSGTAYAESNVNELCPVHATPAQ